MVRVLVFVASVSCCAAVLADTIRVPQDQTTIQAGINAAVDGDTVLVADGTYTGPGNKNLTLGGRAVWLRSESGPESCVIDCEDDGRGFVLDSTGETLESVIDGFRITRAVTITVESGAGILCHESSPTIRNCIIDSCFAGANGGGIDLVLSDALIANCRIVSNSAGLDGGGAAIGTIGNPMFVNCLVAANYTGLGAYTCGGGNSGAGLQIGGNALIVNSTIVGNNAYCGTGGGVDADNNLSAPIIVNSVIWFNWPGQITFATPTGTVVRYSNIQFGWPGEHNIGVDPLFVSLAGPDNNPLTWEDNDYRLSAGSPCIDAGTVCALVGDPADLDDDGDTVEYLPLDLDAEGRFFDDPNMVDTGNGQPAVVDMGAYEFGGDGPQPCPGDTNGDGEIDLTDLSVLLGNFGSSAARMSDGDFDCNGTVDLADLSALLAQFGTICQ